MEKLPDGRLKRAVLISIAIGAMSAPLAETIIQALRVVAKAMEIFPAK